MRKPALPLSWESTLIARTCHVQRLAAVDRGQVDLACIEGVHRATVRDEGAVALTAQAQARAGLDLQGGSQLIGS